MSSAPDVPSVWGPPTVGMPPGPPMREEHDPEVRDWLARQQVLRAQGFRVDPPKKKYSWRRGAIFGLAAIAVLVVGLAAIRVAAGVLEDETLGDSERTESSVPSTLRGGVVYAPRHSVWSVVLLTQPTVGERPIDADVSATMYTAYGSDGDVMLVVDIPGASPIADLDLIDFLRRTEPMSDLDARPTEIDGEHGVEYDGFIDVAGQSVHMQGVALEYHGHLLQFSFLDAGGDDLAVGDAFVDTIRLIGT